MTEETLFYNFISHVSLIDEVFSIHLSRLLPSYWAQMVSQSRDGWEDSRELIVFYNKYIRDHQMIDKNLNINTKSTTNTAQR